MRNAEDHIYRFDDVQIDTRNLKLTVGSAFRPLEPKSFRLLRFLVENPGRVLTKEEIMGARFADLGDCSRQGVIGDNRVGPDRARRSSGRLQLDFQLPSCFFGANPTAHEVRVALFRSKLDLLSLELR